jgi:6-phosphogluconolactonase (cycloisomerase 2 family)
MGRAALATAVSLAVGLGLTACSRDYTVAYVYAASAGNQNVAAFGVDYQSGTLVQLEGSPFPLNGRTPVSMVTSPNSKYLYVVSHDDSEIDPFAIGTDGKLYAQNSVKTVGSFPVTAAIDPTGAFLYVAVTLQPQYTPGANPGPGSINIFPINSDGSLGTPAVQLVGDNPVGIAVSPLNNFVYVVDSENPTLSTAVGQLLSFSRNPTTGALTPLPGTVINTSGPKTVATGINAGTVPSAIVEEPTARYVYVTDENQNEIYGYQVSSGGLLTTQTSSPYPTGLFPVAVTVDPRGLYLYTANYAASTVGVYSISPTNGSLAGYSGGNNSVATGPTCVTIEPALGIYLYTSNKLDNSISGAQLNPHDGSLSAIENTPFTVGALPSCVATAANGAHASSLVNP